MMAAMAATRPPVSVRPVDSCSFPYPAPNIQLLFSTSERVFFSSPLCFKESVMGVRKGFALRDLVAVVGIILPLLALLPVACQRVRHVGVSDRTLAIHNLKQVALVMHSYNDQF